MKADVACVSGGCWSLEKGITPALQNLTDIVTDSHLSEDIFCELREQPFGLQLT